MIYLSLPNEVDTSGAVRKGLAMGKRVVVPKMNVKRGTLELREIKSARDLARGPYGVPEPRAERTRKVPLKEVDCMVLPGLAFDLKGNRLGRGKGYFDKLLARAPKKAARIALAFPFQVVDKLPLERHDRPVDIVLS